MPSLRRNLAYSLTYQVISVLLPLITIPYLSRVLGAHTLGTFSYTQAVAGYFVLFAMMGVESHGSRVIAAHRGNRADLTITFWSVWCVQAALTALACVGYLVYTLVWASSPLLAALWLPQVVAAGADITWLFSGLEDFRVTVTRSALFKVLSLALIFLLVRSPDDLGTYVALTSVSALIAILIFWPLALRRVGRPVVDAHQAAGHLRKNLILFIPQVAASAFTLLTKIMLGMMASMAATGYFDLAYRITRTPYAIVPAVGAVMLPHAAALVSRSGTAGLKESITRTLPAVTWAALALGGGIGAVSPEFVPLFLGPGYEAVVPVVILMAAQLPFLAWENVIRTQYLFPLHKDRQYVAAVLAGGMLNVALNLLLIPHWGASGAAVSLLAAEALIAVTRVWNAHGDVALGSTALACLPLLASGALMMVAVRLTAVVLTGAAGLGVEIAVGGAVYLLSSFALSRHVRTLLGQVRRHQEVA